MSGSEPFSDISASPAHVAEWPIRDCQRGLFADSVGLVWAHVGGFVAGMMLVPAFKQKGMPLFQPAHSRPFEIERRRSPWG
jgi:hypothetical protein